MNLHDSQKAWVAFMPKYTNAYNTVMIESANQSLFNETFNAQIPRIIQIIFNKVFLIQIDGGKYLTKKRDPRKLGDATTLSREKELYLFNVGLKFVCSE